MLRVNLGCPLYCEGYECVDLHPHDERVTQSDATEYLKTTTKRYDEIYSKNLIEHIIDINDFMLYATMKLNPGGKLIIITDNAEFVPFYLPFWINHTGIGAHSKDEYAQSISHNGTHHYMIFTKMHLYNIMKLFMFKDISVKRMTFGARLIAIGVKQ